MEMVFRAALWQLRQAGGVDGANETAVAVNIAESAVESCSRESVYHADITSRLQSVGTQTEDPGTRDTTADATAQTGPQAERPTATIRPFDTIPQQSTSTERAMPPPRPEILRRTDTDGFIPIPAGYESDYWDSDYDDFGDVY